MPASAESASDFATPRAMQMARVIVKFTDPTLNPAQNDYFKDLARDTGVRFVYIRPITGGAHLLQVEGAVDAEHIQRIVEGLAKKPGVEFAEIDQRMRTMPQY